MKKKTVVVVGSGKAGFEKTYSVFLKANVDVVAVDPPKSAQDLPKPLLDADGILFGGSWPVTREIMEQLTNCRVIGRFGLGYDSIEVNAATENEIAIVVARGFCEEEMADHVMAFMLAWYRHIIFHDRRIRSGQSIPGNMTIPRMSRLTAGLCGFGGVARNVAGKLIAFGMHVIAYDPYVPDINFSRLGVERVDLNELLARSDVVSIHCALTDDTRHLFSEDAFQQMKSNALLINTARGAIVDTKALVSALEKGHIAGACLDVLEEGATESYRLDQYDRIVVTPHMAYNSEAALEDLYRIAATNVLNVLEGKKPNGLVNPEVIHGLKLI